MKSRITQTTFSSIPDVYRSAALMYAQQRYDELKGEMGVRVMYAMALAAADTFGFGQKRINTLLSAFLEIVGGYSEDTYTKKERKADAPADMETVKRMSDNMRLELERRGIKIDIV